jgi:hypothetical protein
MQPTGRTRGMVARGTAASLAFLLVLPFAGMGTALAQQTGNAPPVGAPNSQPAPVPRAPENAPPPAGAATPDASQSQQPPGASTPPDTGQPQQQPSQPELKPPSSRPAEPAQPNPDAPVGTAVAPYEKGVGVGASRPAGAVIAPAKQRRTRSFLVKSALVIGAAVAVGTVVGLSNASPSRPAGAH